VAQCSVQGQALLASPGDPATGCWMIRLVDKHHNHGTHIFAWNLYLCSVIAASARPSEAGSSNNYNTSDNYTGDRKSFSNHNHNKC
jgi:hypothetical protein